MHRATYRAVKENNSIDVFLTINEQLTRQIIITEISMSDHNLIQMEANIKKNMLGGLVPTLAIRITEILYRTFVSVLIVSP